MCRDVQRHPEQSIPLFGWFFLSTLAASEAHTLGLYKSAEMLGTSRIIHWPIKSPPELIFSKWMPVKTFRAADVSRHNLISSSICLFARKSAQHDSDN